MKFEDIKVSTKTIIAVTNLTIDINLLFDYLETTPYKIIKKKRGRKKKKDNINLNMDVAEGSIITLKYQDDIKGVETKNKKKNLSRKKYFRNALTVIMVLKDNNLNKLINFKISKNGKFQITGCKKLEHAEKIIKYTWNIIKDNKNIYNLEDKHFKTVFNTVMTNIDFNVGYLINRENLNKYINQHTEYNSLLETSFGYTGVNIKIPVKRDLSTLDLPCLKNINNEWITTQVNAGPYLNKNKKKRYNTFLVFHSGNVIMSGMIKEIMKPDYIFFNKILKDSKDIIKERLDI